MGLLDLIGPSKELSNDELDALEVPNDEYIPDDYLLGLKPYPTEESVEPIIVDEGGDN